MKRVLLLLLASSVSACAYNPLSLPGDAAAVEQQADPSGEVGQVGEAGEVPDGAASAGAALIAEGRAELAAGNTTRAAASIERALRIEPRNSLWWVELGNVRLAEGDREQALALGQRALRLAGSDRSARAAAERLIEQADGG